MDSKAVNARYAVIGEPSELQICYANNGYMAVDFHIPFTKDEMDFRKAHDSSESTTQEKVFSGKAAHSSTPHLGDNAILKLVNYLERLPTGLAILNASGGSADNTVPAQAELEVDPSRTFVDGVGPRLVKLVREIQNLEREFLGFENQAFKPSHPTLNIGILETLPDSLRLLVSFRITPQISEAVMNGWVSRLVEFASKNAMLGSLFKLTPPAMTDLKSPLITSAITVAGELELPSQPITKAACNESSVYRAHGIDCMVFGSGVSYGNSHTANEFNFLSQLEKSTVFYHRLAQRLCL
jgi:succinyl-diaminopimelate desuccinylase